MPGIVIAPLVTPYDSGLRVDLESARRLMEIVAGAGVGLFTSGTTGEMPLLAPEEKVGLARLALDVARGRVPVLAGVGGPDPGRVLEEARLLSDVGVDYLVIPPPYYYRPGPGEVEAFYSWLAGSLDARILVYIIPSHVGYTVPIDVLERLAREHSNIAGVKATVEDAVYLSRIILRVKTVRRDFLVFSGLDSMLSYNLLAGGDGGIVAGANLVPLLHQTLVEALSRGDVSTARRLHLELVLLGEVLARARSLQGGIKTILSWMGVIGSRLVRPPLPQEDEGTAEAVVEAWRQSGLERYLPRGSTGGAP